MIVTRHKSAYKPGLEIRAWKYLRLSAILLVPLVWFHSILNTLVIGAHNLSLSLVAERWATPAWKIYDILLLTFAFSHGITGLRQILFDYISNRKWRASLGILLFIFWLALSVVGAISIIGGVPQ